MVATPGEVATAAKYIVDRFGVPVETSEDRGFNEAEEDGSNAGGAGGGMVDAAMEKERDQLAQVCDGGATEQKQLA